MRHSPAQTGTVPPDQDGCRVSHRLEGDRVDNLEHGSPRLLNRIHAEHHPCGSSVVSPSSISRPCPHHALLITSHNVQPIISPRNLLVVPLFTLDQPQTDNDPLGALLVGLACVRVLRGSLLEEVGLDLLGSGDLRRCKKRAEVECQLSSGLVFRSRSSSWNIGLERKIGKVRND
jgi:hypothetical protein